MPKNQTLVLNHLQIEQKINRIARQVYENCFEEDQIVLVGIADRGLHLANRIKSILEKISPLKMEITALIIDKNAPLKENPTLGIDKSKLNGKVVILIDDVLNTGLTLIYAVKHILNSPVKQLITVALVDRRHRLYPVKADFVGLTLATTIQEHISVEFGKGKDAVYLR